jgi:hypothetical protein
MFENENFDGEEVPNEDDFIEEQDRSRSILYAT